MCFCADPGACVGVQQSKVWLGAWGGLSCCRFEMSSHHWSTRGELACSAACLYSPDPEDKSLQSEKDFSKSGVAGKQKKRRGLWCYSYSLYVNVSFCCVQIPFAPGLPLSSSSQQMWVRLISMFKREISTTASG